MAEQDPAGGCRRAEKQLPGERAGSALWGRSSLLRHFTGKLNVGEGWDMGKTRNQGEGDGKDPPSARVCCGEPMSVGHHEPRGTVAGPGVLQRLTASAWL